MLVVMMMLMTLMLKLVMLMLMRILCVDDGDVVDVDDHADDEASC